MVVYIVDKDYIDRQRCLLEPQTNSEQYPSMATISNVPRVSNQPDNDDDEIIWLGNVSMTEIVVERKLRLQSIVESDLETASQSMISMTPREYRPALEHDQNDGASNKVLNEVAMEGGEFTLRINEIPLYRNEFQILQRTVITPRAQPFLGQVRCQSTALAQLSRSPRVRPPNGRPISRYRLPKCPGGISRESGGNCPCAAVFGASEVSIDSSGPAESIPPGPAAERPAYLEIQAPEVPWGHISRVGPSGPAESIPPGPAADLEIQAPEVPWGHTGQMHTDSDVHRLRCPQAPMPTRSDGHRIRCPQAQMPTGSDAHRLRCPQAQMHTGSDAHSVLETVQAAIAASRTITTNPYTP
ncbi:hypothetical protein Ddc_10774 [Ditylenchus destructor]|nr:hypothetical protein Ddc_10774 [Ditylenchus destructor]